MLAKTEVWLAEGNTERKSIVRQAVDGDAAAWNAFVLAQGEGTFFHRFEWAGVLRQAFGHKTYFLLAETEGKLSGVLPLAHVKSALFGNTLVSTPFCVYGGIVSSTVSAFEALQIAACELATRLGVDHLEMRNRRRSHPDWPVKDLYVSFQRQISTDSETNMLAIPRKQRAMVRKGMQKGLQMRLDNDVVDLYRMYAESLRNLGTPVVSRSYLQILRDTFGPDVEIVTITHNDVAVSSVMNFRFRDQILPYYGGGSSAARAVAANDFMYWQVMERARAQGLTSFDFGRSKRGTGAFDFKSNWGFEPQPLYYEYFLVRATQMPNLSPTNPTYSRPIQLWKRLPLPVANFVGPFVAKYLG